MGYTDGRQRLSTAPEKDVGFPYAHTWGADSERISHEMSRWSWQSYLVHDDGFADWVDRARPRPTHRQWSQYLRWVAARIPVEPLRVAATAIVKGRASAGAALVADGGHRLPAVELSARGKNLLEASAPSARRTWATRSASPRPSIVHTLSPTSRRPSATPDRSAARPDASVLALCDPAPAVPLAVMGEIRGGTPLPATRGSDPC